METWEWKCFLASIIQVSGFTVIGYVTGRTSQWIASQLWALESCTTFMPRFDLLTALSTITMFLMGVYLIKFLIPIFEPSVS